MFDVNIRTIKKGRLHTISYILKKFILNYTIKKFENVQSTFY